MRSYADLTDDVLAGLVQQGDRNAFTVIYNRYWALLHRFSQRMLRDEDLATDVIQDVFTRLWEHSADLRITVSLSSYLYGATRNQIIRLIRKEKVRADYLSGLRVEEAVPITDNEVRERELARLIEQEVSRLPAKMRMVFELSRKAHLSYKEIADQINISEGTVRKQVHNAIRLLRARLSSYFFGIVAWLILWLGQ